LLYSSEGTGEDVAADSQGAELIWPPQESFVHYLPKEVADCYRKAKLSENNDPNVFAFYIRKALEAICDDYGIPKKKGNTEIPENLNVRLKQLFQQNVLPSQLKEMLTDLELMMKDVREFGNRGVHGTVEPESVPRIRDIFRAIVQCIYVIPNWISEFHKARKGERH
jgi:hypothetical protein